MSVRSDVLRTLEERRGSFFSGEQLAEQLGVSRAAVWKAIKQLEKEGYAIEAVPNKGYCLGKHADVMSEEGIRAYLPENLQTLQIEVYKETTSTNVLAKQDAINGKSEGRLYVAEQQTAGKGRRGRSFVSVPGGNICMSLLLRPGIGAEDAVFITTAVCVAVHRAIRIVTGIITDIKWVNDLYYQGKKVCGILTEAVTDCETGLVDCVIPGIGINFNIAPEQFPEELREIAGSLFDGMNRYNVTRNQLTAEIVTQIYMVLDDLKERKFLQEYKEHSMLLGKKIWILTNEGKEEATAIDVDESGGLVVRLADDSVKTLNTGEVSVREQK